MMMDVQPPPEGRARSLAGQGPIEDGFNPEHSDPTTRLIVKLSRWLRQQPEFVQTFALGRADRRRMARAIAKTVTTIPVPGQPEHKPPRTIIVKKA